MEYISKNTLSKIERMKRKAKKKSLEMIDRLSKDPNAGSNTRIQKSAMGKTANSHAKKLGSILHHDAAEKTIETIDKMSDPDKRRDLVKKKIKELKNKD
jgi:hypothetical protein